MDDPPAPADPTDVGSLDAIVNALYASVSFEVGETPDWERFRSLFHPAALMVRVADDPSDDWRTEVSYSHLARLQVFGCSVFLQRLADGVLEFRGRDRKRLASHSHSPKLSVGRVLHNQKMPSTAGPGADRGAAFAVAGTI